MSYQPRSSLLYQALADVVVGNDATERSCLAASAMTANQAVPPVIARGTAVAGTKLQFTAYGAYTLPPLLSGISLDFRIVLGAASFTVTIPLSLFTALNISAGLLPCYFNVGLTFRTVGAAAVVKRAGSLLFLDTAGKPAYQGLRGADLAVDTTTDLAFDARAKWSAANASANLTVDSAELAMIG